MRQPLPRVFITVAVTGNLTTPEQTPHLPTRGVVHAFSDVALRRSEHGHLT
jgi:hypothetical protein